MNQLNETLRAIRVQIAAEEMQPKPDLKKLKELRKQQKQCLHELGYDDL